MKFITKIKERLNSYLEFDNSLLFEHCYERVRIFGGAIRDVIADQPINDVDIVVVTKSDREHVERVLDSQGWAKSDFLCGRDLTAVYTDNRIINEPKTWIKNNKVIQIIKAHYDKIYHHSGISHRDIQSVRRKHNFDLPLFCQNVDLSCCGVSYDGINLYENCEFAIQHCLQRKYVIQTGAAMYNQKRISHRLNKLSDRGWERTKMLTADLRDLKINFLLSDEPKEWITENIDLSQFYSHRTADNRLDFGMYFIR